jgi:hypothetical protein
MSGHNNVVGAIKLIWCSALGLISVCLPVNLRKVFSTQAKLYVCLLVSFDLCFSTDSLWFGVEYRKIVHSRFRNTYSHRKSVDFRLKTVSLNVFN